MAYVYCVPARIASMNHALNNHISGQLEINGNIINFKTRGHIVKATNKVYKNCPWKPSKQQLVLIDGDIIGNEIIVDHIEKDYLPDVKINSHHPSLNELGEIFNRLPLATKLIKKSKDMHPARARSVAIVDRYIGPREIQKEVVHFAFDGSEMKIWSVNLHTGLLAQTKYQDYMATAIEPIIGFSSKPTCQRTDVPDIVETVEEECPF